MIPVFIGLTINKINKVQICILSSCLMSLKLLAKVTHKASLIKVAFNYPIQSEDECFRKYVLKCSSQRVECWNISCDETKSPANVFLSILIWSPNTWYWKLTPLLDPELLDPCTDSNVLVLMLSSILQDSICFSLFMYPGEFTRSTFYSIHM